MVIKWDLYGDYIYNYIYMDTYIIIHCICISPSNYRLNSLGKSYTYHIITYNYCIYIYIYSIWVNFITTSRRSTTSRGIMVNGFGKSSPFMAARFRFVKYHNLPRYLLSLYVIIWYMYVYVTLPQTIQTIVRWGYTVICG